jgi:hypothetical protein
VGVANGGAALGGRQYEEWAFSSTRGKFDRWFCTS